MQNEERWDILDKDRRFLRKAFRGSPLNDGEYHVNVAIWTLTRDRQVLLTLRAPEKEIYPNTWENPGGAALSGETSVMAALRELNEETGIIANENELSFIDTTLNGHSFFDIFTVCRNQDTPIALQEGETVDFRWVDLGTLDKMAETYELAKPIAQRYCKMRDIIIAKMAEYTAG